MDNLHFLKGANLLKQTNLHSCWCLTSGLDNLHSNTLHNPRHIHKFLFCSTTLLIVQFIVIMATGIMVLVIFLTGAVILYQIPQVFLSFSQIGGSVVKGAGIELQLFTCFVLGSFIVEAQLISCII